MASNDRSLNFEPNRAVTRFTKLIIKLTPTSFFKRPDLHRLESKNGIVPTLLISKTYRNVTLNVSKPIESQRSKNKTYL